MVEHTRTLDFKIAFAIGLGTMIAAGIFSLSGIAVDAIGSWAVVAFVIAAVIAGVTAAAYSEFASVYSENGGGYLFTSRTFEEQDLLTYGIGMSLFLGYTGTTAFYLATMDHWFFRFVFVGPLEPLHALPHGSTGIAAAVLLGVLNARGTEESGGFQLIVTGAKVAVLIAFIGGAFAYAGPTGAIDTFGAEFSSGSGAGTGVVDVLSISALAFITFFGFSAIAASAGEIIEPRKTVPRAIAASMITVTILYAFVIVAMVNSPVPAEVVAEEGETAMGLVAESFLGDVGVALIVAGAIFSMVSASNASILAATGIGSLMGRRGQAPRPFARIHPDYGTPFWSVTAAIGTIVVLIGAFLAVFPAEGPALAGLNLGLDALTGFATLNLLLPLAVVNVALIYSRRRFPDVERGFRVPGVPIVPIVGILANLGLIYNLPIDGVATGVLLTLAMIVAYLLWGGNPEIAELYERVVEPESGPSPSESGGGEAVATAGGEERYRVLVPVARPERAPEYVRLAAALGEARGEDPLIQVVNITELPDQTANELVTETAQGRADRISDRLGEADLDVEYTVEGHVSRDVAFDVVHTAREDEADLIVMGYPEEHRAVTEGVKYGAPCDVVYVGPDVSETDLGTVTVGVGGGPHQAALIDLVEGLGTRGADVHLVNVSPTGGKGTHEEAEQELETLADVESLTTHDVTAESVAAGLVDVAAETGGVLIVGASRDRRLRRYVFGGTPDRAVDLAGRRDVPVLIYASSAGLPGRFEDYLFPIYRYFMKLRAGGQRRSADPSQPAEVRSDGDA